MKKRQHCVDRVYNVTNAHILKSQRINVFNIIENDGLTFIYHNGKQKYENRKRLNTLPKVDAI